MNGVAGGTSQGSKDDLVLGDLDIGTIRELYCPEEDPGNPYVSPYYGSYEGFPPLYVVWDGGELLCADNVRFCKKVKEAGVVLETRQWEGTFHTFEILAGMLPEAKKEISCSIGFINRNL
jgi:acetyl esterase/lipase